MNCYIWAFRTSTVAMRLSIESAFAFGNIDYLLGIFKDTYDYDKGRVNNATFIITEAEKIKQNMKEKQIFNITQLSGIYNIIIKNCGIIIVYYTMDL